VRIALGLPTEVAGRNDFVTDPLTEPLVEDEVLPPKTVRQTTLLHLVCVLDDPTFEVPYVREAVVLEPGARLLAADATRAIQGDLLVPMDTQQFRCSLQLIAESHDIRRDRSFEVPDLRLVVVAHVDDDRVRIIDVLIHLFGREVLANVGDIERRIIESVSHDLRADLDGESEERRLGTVFDCDLVRYTSQLGLCLYPGIERLPVLLGNIHLGVDPLVRHVDATETVPLRPLLEQAVSKGLRIRDAYVAVERNGPARTWVGGRSAALLDATQETVGARVIHAAE